MLKGSHSDKSLAQQALRLTLRSAFIARSLISKPEISYVNINDQKRKYKITYISIYSEPNQATGSKNDKANQ